MMQLNDATDIAVRRWLSDHTEVNLQTQSMQFIVYCKNGRFVQQYWWNGTGANGLLIPGAGREWFSLDPTGTGREWNQWNGTVTGFHFTSIPVSLSKTGLDVEANQI